MLSKRAKRRWGYAVDAHSASIRTGCRVLLASACPSSVEQRVVKIVEAAGAREAQRMLADRTIDVLIASSSGLEIAHESEGILGSFFTHHLVAGLRGAADPRGDGVVTVTDVFAYAKERTVRDTASISPRPQHPSFSMNLPSRGLRLSATTMRK